MSHPLSLYHWRIVIALLGKDGSFLFFFPDLIYDLRNYAFPKETLKFLKKNRLFHSYHQKDNSPQEHPSLAHACSWEQVFSRSFQVPATALS